MLSFVVDHPAMEWREFCRRIFYYPKIWPPEKLMIEREAIE
jgi:hypothetical protein